jgi:hypothetical protein
MMDSIADVVDVIDKAMNSKGVGDNDFKAYMDLMAEFGKNLEPTSEKAEVEVGGDSVSCQKIVFVITDEQLVKLYSDLYDLLEDDDQLRNQVDDLFNNPLVETTNTNLSYNDMLKELKNLINQIEHNFTGDITYSLFIGNKDRLLNMEIDANTKVMGEKIRLRMTFDFGASAKDRWTVNVSVQEGGDRSSVKIIWDYKERANSVENSLNFTSSDDDQFTLKSEWSPERGNFTLSYEDRWGDTDEITGVFTINGTGFRLSIDNPLPDYYDAVLNIELVGEAGANIKQISYINIDQWGETLIDKLEDLYYELEYFF